VLLVGTTDMDRRFHPFGIGVTSNEATEDFLFLFNLLKASFARLHDGNEYKPKVIFSVIPAAKNVLLGQKRKRGRPAKAKKALLKQ